MIEHIRYLWQVLVVASVLLLLGLVLIPKIDVDLSLKAYIISLFVITLINIITFQVMVRGVIKMNKEGIVYLLGGIGLKFLLYLGYILVFWAVTKNLSKGFIITFFALYLIFTFFLAENLLKILKNK
ncbi:MAG: hypothetical protein ABFS28_02920 [Bacteroidota bacterium]